MSIIADILNVFGTVLEAFFLYRLVDLFYEKRFAFFKQYRNSRMLTWLMIGCYVLIVLGLNQVALTSPYTVVISFIQNILCISVFWKSDVLEAVATVGGYLLILYVLGGTEIAITGLLGGDDLICATTMENGMTRVIYLVIIIPIACFVNQLVYIWFRKRLKSYAGLKFFAIISFIGLLGCTFLQIQMLSSFNIAVNMAWLVLMVLISIVLFVGYYITKSKQLQERLRLVDEQNEMLERNYEQLKDFYSANAKLYHDMNHHLNAMYYMLQQGEREQAKEYIESIKEPIDSFAVKLRTGIDVLDVILYEAERKAQEKNVLLQMEVSKLPQDMVVKKKDLCALLANLLDNALEAAQKEVKMLIKSLQGQLLIQVQNDYSVEPVRKGERFVTTKKDKQSHGFGTQNIAYVVQQYDGSMNYKIQDGVFCVDIMLNL